MMKNMRRGIPSLFKAGTTHLDGIEEAVIRNLKACKQLTEITRTSLGPNGMNKMIINHLDKLFVTSDTATIINEMEIDHPAAKMIVMASQMQEQEIGDGSNFVVCLAGGLLGNAEELLRMGLHPSEVISGYKKAGLKCIEFLEAATVEKLTTAQFFEKDAIVRLINAPISAKQEGYSKFLTSLVADACLAVMPENPANFNVDNVRVARVMGGNIFQSEVIKGVVVNRSTEGTVKHVDEARIAVFNCAIDATSTETKQNVVLQSADQLLQYAESEEKDLESMIQSIADSGVNVVVTSSSIDDMAMHFMEKHGLMVIRLTSKFEMRRLCRTVNARALVSLGPVSKDHQGYAKKVYVRNVGAAKVIVFEQDTRESRVSTIILRASTMNLLNDLGRATDDGVNTVKAASIDGCLVPGGGAIDIELARKLSVFAATLSGLDQYSIQQFAKAMEVIPRTLAENGGFVAMDTISQLYAAHEEKGGEVMGVDIKTGGVKNMKEANILDLVATRRQAIELALDATLTVLSVDKIVQAKPAGGPRAKGQGGGHWDDQD